MRDDGDMDMNLSTAAPIASSNIGFKMLKLNGWKEGTGLGISQQGRLEPIEACLKTNKRGLGAEKVKKIDLGTDRVKKTHHLDETDLVTKSEKLAARKKAKTVSKRIRKMQEIEKKIQEKEFERAFFREFWPDNV